MCYLLDELTAYEEGFTDIMTPDHTAERHETFMGIQQSSSSPTRQDFFTLENKLPSIPSPLLVPTKPQSTIPQFAHNQSLHWLSLPPRTFKCDAHYQHHSATSLLPRARNLPSVPITPSHRRHTTTTHPSPLKNSSHTFT